MKRREFITGLVGATMLPMMARAENYPTRPVKIIVPFAPAGGTDILGRLFGEWLSERLNQPFIIENRPGANTNVGTEAVTKSVPDGYTLLVTDLVLQPMRPCTTSSIIISYVTLHPVSGLIRQPLVMVVNSAFPAKTVLDFIAFAKANPDVVNMASAGVGNVTQLTGELFKMMTGIHMTHVAYRGSGPALTDLLAGHVQVMFTSMPAAIKYIQAGNLRALAVTTAMRSELLPDVPTVSEYVPGYEASNWYGVDVPKRTPVEIINKLNKEINAGLDDPKMQERLAALGGGILLHGSPADFGELIAEETGKWGTVIRAANVKVE